MYLWIAWIFLGIAAIMGILGFFVPIGRSRGLARAMFYIFLMAGVAAFLVRFMYLTNNRG